MDSDQESDFELWDEPDFIELNVVPSLSVGARRSVANVSETPIILNILNDDCWRHILDYVSVDDIEWSKSVSLEWQAMVHRYMLGVRIRIETISNVWDVDEQIRRRKCRVLTMTSEPVCFAAALNRWGESVRELVFDAKGASHAELRALGENCPNLADITLVRLRWHSPSCDWAANFRNLKRVCFENSVMVDSCIREFLKNNTIEELVIRMSESFSGRFFEEGNEDLKKLKTVILSHCLDLKLDNLLSAVKSGNLAEVTKLELRYCGQNPPQRLSLLLDKMPQLEHLTLDFDVDLLDEEVIEAVTRLERLKHLGWHNGAVFRGKELRDVRKYVSLLSRRPPGPGPPALEDRRTYVRQMHLANASMDAAFRFRLEHARRRKKAVGTPRCTRSDVESPVMTSARGPRGLGSDSSSA